MSADLVRRLRLAATTFKPSTRRGLHALLTEAADWITELEAPQRIIELAATTGVSATEIAKIISQLRRIHLSECAIPMGLGDFCTCREYWPD